MYSLLNIVLVKNNAPGMSSGTDLRSARSTASFVKSVGVTCQYLPSPIGENCLLWKTTPSTVLGNFGDNTRLIITRATRNFELIASYIDTPHVPVTSASTIRSKILYSFSERSKCFSVAFLFASSSANRFCSASILLCSSSAF